MTQCDDSTLTFTREMNQKEFYLEGKVKGSSRLKLSPIPHRPDRSFQKELSLDRT